MNVFIDTNILPDIYRIFKDKLDESDKVFALHQYGQSKIWLLLLLNNEFSRNRSEL